MTRVRSRMQRLMDISHEVNEKREIASGAPFVVIAVVKPLRILIDLRRNTISIRAPRWQVDLLIM